MKVPLDRFLLDSNKATELILLNACKEFVYIAGVGVTRADQARVQYKMIKNTKLQKIQFTLVVPELTSPPSICDPAVLLLEPG